MPVLTTQPDDIQATANTIASVKLDLPQGTQSPHLVVEQEQAVLGLCDNAQFTPVLDITGPYHLTLGLHDGRLVLDIMGLHDKRLPTFVLSMRPYAKLITDYFMMVESFETARASGNPYQLEAIDMGRRGIHDEAASLLRARLLDKVSIDHATARRLFTLICVLHLNQPRHGAMLHG